MCGYNTMNSDRIRQDDEYEITSFMNKFKYVYSINPNDNTPFHVYKTLILPQCGLELNEDNVIRSALLHSKNQFNNIYLIGVNWGEKEDAKCMIDVQQLKQESLLDKDAEILRVKYPTKTRYQTKGEPYTIKEEIKHVKRFEEHLDNRKFINYGISCHGSRIPYDFIECYALIHYAPAESMPMFHYGDIFCKKTSIQN